MARVVELLGSPPGRSLMGRDFLSLRDYTKEELWCIMALAKQMKAEPEQAVLTGKTLGMIFAKSSTRTRVSFEVGMYQLGGYALFLNQHDIQLGRGETIGDTARVLSRYLDAIMIRTYSHSQVEELAHWSSVPVINGLTDLFHPCQAITDFFTIHEHYGGLAGLKLAFIGDSNNIANSLLVGAAHLGVDFVLACPRGYQPEAGLLAYAQRVAAREGSTVAVSHDPTEAVQGAHVLYTDVWTSMGQEAEQAERRRVFQRYQINQDLVRKAAEGAIVMHCLPAHRGEEITADVLESGQSVVLQQAENRLHVQKALLALVLNEG